jgi:hypothetical protein
VPTIVGSFVYVCDGEHYHTGEILAEISHEHYLVRFDNPTDARVPMPMELVSTTEMAAPHGVHGVGRPWSFFATRDDLDRWITWLDTPSEPRMNVVRSINPRDRH